MSSRLKPFTAAGVPDPPRGTVTIVPPKHGPKAHAADAPKSGPATRPRPVQTAVRAIRPVCVYRKATSDAFCALPALMVPKTRAGREGGLVTRPRPDAALAGMGEGSRAVQRAVLGRRCGRRRYQVSRSAAWISRVRSGSTPAARA